ncbi:hypothetical protein RX799_24740 [Klebsiella oxytoca]|uniref:hypothetical protein n=1 Tax=Klebsiella oxytoca TaxID=571 RepID=UPI00384D8F91
MGSVRKLIQLKQSGLTDEQVDAIVDFVESNQEPLATKAALMEVKTELKADIAEVKVNLAEVKADVKAVKAELKADIAELKVDMAAIRQSISHMDNRLTLRLGGFAVFIVSVIGALKLFA